MAVSDELTHDVAATGVDGPRWSRPRLLGAALLLAAAWGVSFAAVPLHLGWVLPLLIWVGTALLLRGRTLLDRLVLSLAVLAGLTCAVGLLLSVWPWGLAATPVAGLAFTGLVGFAVATGRRWEFPVRNLGPGEVGVVAATLGCAALAVHPFLGRDFFGRLSILAPGDDFARHFTVYDTIRVVNGYLFMHRPTATPFLDKGYESYPQGAHFIYALLANFMPQGADHSNTVASFDLLITFDVGTFVAMCLAVLWAVRWVAGPLLRTWAALPLLAAIAGYLFFGEPVTMLTHGFPSEMFGAALIAILTAVVIRPVRSFAEQCLILACLFTAISFSYFLFLPYAGMAVLVWMVNARREVVRHRWAIAAMIVVVGALSLLSPAVNVVYSPAGVADRLLFTGAIGKVNRSVALAWLCLAVAGATVGWRKGSRPWRTSLILLLSSLLPVIALFIDHKVNGRSQTYYLEKLLHEMILAAVVSAGSVLLLVRRDLAAAPARRRWAAQVPAVALAVGFFVAVSALSQDNPDFTGRNHVTGKNAMPQVGTDTKTAIHLFPRADGRITWVQLGSRLDTAGRWGTHWASLYTAVLQRNYRAEWSLYFWGNPWTANSETDVAEFLMTSPEPYRILVNDTMSYEMLARIKARYPTVNLQVVDLRNKR